MSDDRQLTKEEAIAFFDSGAWREMTPEERFRFQLYQRKLCMPFDEFHKAAEVALGRPVWTHEFAFRDSLKAELNGHARKATMTDILDKIPADKKVLLVDPDNFDENKLADAINQDAKPQDSP